MRVLLDECIDWRLGRELASHEGKTARGHRQNMPAMAGAGGPPVEGDHDEGYGGGFDDERRAGGSAAPARAKTPVNDLDDDIPF